MLRYFSQLNKLKAFAQDGKVGKLYDFYFDDRDWIIQNIIIKKGFCDKSKTFLIRISDFNLRTDYKRINLDINKSQVYHNSEVDRKLPILHSDYVLSKIFGFPNLWSISDAADSDEGLLYSNEFTPHLRSIQEVTGFRVKGFGQDEGYVSDFLIDISDWTIKYIIVTKRKFLPGGKKIIINATSVKLNLIYPTAMLAA